MLGVYFRFIKYDSYFPTSSCLLVRRITSPVCFTSPNGAARWNLENPKGSVSVYRVNFRPGTKKMQFLPTKRTFWIGKRDGRGWEEARHSCRGEGVAAARRVWPCRPRSPVQNGTFWRATDASWGSRRGYSEKSFIMTNCDFAEAKGIKVCTSFPCQSVVNLKIFPTRMYIMLQIIVKQTHRVMYPVWLECVKQ